MSNQGIRTDSGWREVCLKNGIACRFGCDATILAQKNQKFPCSRVTIAVVDQGIQFNVQVLKFNSRWGMRVPDDASFTLVQGIRNPGKHSIQYYIISCAFIH